MFETLSKGFQGLLTKFAGKGRISEDNVKEALREVRLALLEADVNLGVARDFIERVRTQAIGTEVLNGVNPGQMIIKIIHEELVKLMGSEAAPIAFAPSPPTVILMAGLQGAGKTTTCGKLAHYLKRQKKSVLLVAADLQRPAAVEQLRVLGRDLEVPVFTETGVAPPVLCARAVEQARRDLIDVVILDTAGRLHIDDELMTEVAEVARKTSPHEVFLVCDAMTGQDAVNSAKAFDERLPLTGVILTKLDGDARGGAALSVKAVTGKPIKFAGVGEKLDKLDAFHPDRMAERILGMGDVVSLVEKAQEVIDQDEARVQAERMFVGSFNLDDFLGMIGKIRKMGALKDVLGMIPGMSQQLGGMPIDENELPRSEAIIRSMTPHERYHPEVLNTSRRERVAAGAGVTLENVNDLLRGFKETKRQFADMRKMGILGSLLDPTKKMKKEKERELERMKRMGVNLLDPAQVRAYKQFSERKARQEAARKKRRKRG